MKKEPIENAEIQEFMIFELLINPIEKILKQLENKEFRDCDIKWLNGRIHTFITIAAETIGVNPPNGLELENDHRVMNDYMIDWYHERFTKLLNYFKSI